MSVYQQSQRTMTISNTRVRVKVANDTSEVFTTRRGVKQGNGLSCDLFNFCLEFVIRRAGIETEGTIFNKSLQSLGFADDNGILNLSGGAKKACNICRKSRSVPQ